MIRKKRIKTWAIFCFMAAFSVFCLFALSSCGPNGPAKNSAEKVIYHCPMHPTYISDKPGNCPICGMKLVKMEKAPQAPAAASAAAPAPAPEKTLEEVCIEHKCTMNNCTMDVMSKIKPGERVICPICGEVISTASGKVVEIVRAPAIKSSVAATVKKERKLLYYRNPMNPQATSPVPMKDSMGMDYVPVYEESGSEAAGPTITISPEKQQLIGIQTEAVKKMGLTKLIRATGKIAYDPQLMVAQEEFIQALNNEDNVKDSPLKDVIERARDITEAARNKLTLLGMSSGQISDLEKVRRADTSLYLPREGESVWAYVAVYEYEIGLVKIGQAVDIEAVAYPGEVFHGEVGAINPVLDASTRTIQVRIKIPNPDNKLKPEMFVSAQIKVDLGEKLAVPESAVLDTGIRKIVYLSEEGGVLEMREVKLGQKAEGYYEVLDGLKEGDIVVTSGNFLVDSESRLKAAVK